MGNELNPGIVLAAYHICRGHPAHSVSQALSHTRKCSWCQAEIERRKEIHRRSIPSHGWWGRDKKT